MPALTCLIFIMVFPSWNHGGPINYLNSPILRENFEQQNIRG